MQPKGCKFHISELDYISIQNIYFSDLPFLKIILREDPELILLLTHGQIDISLDIFPANAMFFSEVSYYSENMHVSLMTSAFHKFNTICTCWITVRALDYFV